MATKYWLAQNPNGEVDDATVVALKSLATADLNEIDDLVAALPMAAEADLAVDATAATIVTTVNNLLAKMRTAGLLTA
tara:strand:+ start:28 stop:261 length:234 start_codon:yes stop_codon:yes gene_type:complete